MSGKTYKGQTSDDQSELKQAKPKTAVDQALVDLENAVIETGKDFVTLSDSIGACLSPNTPLKGECSDTTSSDMSLLVERIRRITSEVHYIQTSITNVKARVEL